MAETLYVLKRDGNVVGIFTRPPVDPAERAACEEMAADHPDVVAFENRPPPSFDPAKARANAGGTPQERLARARLAVPDKGAPTAAPPPDAIVPQRVDFEDALGRLTDAEWIALRDAMASNVRLARWYERAKTRGSIDLADPEVKTALAAVVGAGLFTKRRLGEIFAAEME